MYKETYCPHNTCGNSAMCHKKEKQKEGNLIFNVFFLMNIFNVFLYNILREKYKNISTLAFLINSNTQL